MAEAVPTDKHDLDRHLMEKRERVMRQALEKGYSFVHEYNIWKLSSLLSRWAFSTSGSFDWPAGAWGCVTYDLRGIDPAAQLTDQAQKLESEGDG